LVNSAIPIVSLSWAETRIDSGLAAVIQASAPLFTALLALRFSRAEVVTGARLVGLLVGFGGVALLVGAQPSGETIAALAVTFSAFCYAEAAASLGDVTRSYPVLLVALSAVWGASYLFIKVGVRTFEPFALVELRLLFAVPILGAFLVWRGELRELRRAAVPGIVLGAINV